MEGDKIPGELRFGQGCITLNSGRKTIKLKVTNTGDRPVQVVIKHVRAHTHDFIISCYYMLYDHEVKLLCISSYYLFAFLLGSQLLGEVHWLCNEHVAL